MTDMAEERRLQRSAGIAGRDGLGAEERNKRSAAIVSRIVESDWWRDARTVLSYRAVKGEVSLEGLREAAEEQGKKLLYPLCLDPGEMIALLPGENAWKKGAFGIWEPVREFSEEIAPENIDLLLCPCSAFDEEGRRMGMGGGYYDRYLPRCRGHIAAVAFEAQKCVRIAAEDWDVAMERVYTEAGVYPSQ